MSSGSHSLFAAIPRVVLGALLDPTYTAKAMAALIADIRAGGIAPDETVVFLHTGGAPALFAQAGLFD